MTVTGVMYLLGFWLAENRQGLARAVLIVGALIHLGIGIVAGTVVDSQQTAPAHWRCCSTWRRRWSR